MIRSPAGAPSRWSFIPACPVLILMMVTAPHARGQAAPPPAAGAAAALPNVGTIPANVKALKSPNEFTQQQRDGIQQFVNAAVQNLLRGNTAQQTRARNALINEAMVNGLPQASAAYLDIYAQALNGAMLQLAGDQSPRVRLNAAIVTAEVARIGNNIHLAPAALAFLNDKSDGIVLWGMKAARWIIPAQLRFPGQFNKQLADAVVPTVAKHSTGQVAAAIALEAYLALTIDIFNPASPPAAAHLPIMAPYVLELLNERLKLYVKGVPPAPRADSFGTGFLTVPRVWQALTPQQQASAMQAMVNLIVLAGQQAQSANPGDLFELARTIQRAAAGVSTAAPAAKQALALATGLNPQTATANAVVQAVQPVVGAVRAVPQFKALKDPPPIQGNEPAPPVASAPTTGNVLIPGQTTQPTGIAAPNGVAVPPGTTPAAPVGPGAAPKPGAGADPKAAKPGDARPDGQPEIKPGSGDPRAPQSARPTSPGGAGAAGAPGAGGGTTPPTPPAPTPTPTPAR